MPGQTNKFKFPYFQAGDIYSPTLEEIRWRTLDENLSALMRLLGNGVVDGWKCFGVLNTNQNLTVEKGKGIVSGYAAGTSEPLTIPISNLSPGVYRVFLSPTNTTYFDMSVSAQMSPVSVPLPPGSIELAQFSINQNGVLENLIDTRSLIGITQQIIDKVNQHVHDGSPGNPSKVDLSSHVQGILPVEHLPQIPTSKLVGSINPALIKNFSHKYLRDIGDLTHLELDQIARDYNKESFQYMGVINAVNIILAIIHRVNFESSNAILKYLANLRVIVPGVTPQNWIDTSASTATIDTANRRILGTAGQPINPPLVQQVIVDKKEGPEGFLGPLVKKLQNVEVEQDGLGSVELSLKKISTTRYYYSNGSLYVDFNAGSVVKWLNIEFDPVVIGSSAELGSEGGPSVKLWAKSGISSRTLQAVNFVEICSSPDKSASLDSKVMGGRWLRLRFDLTRDSAVSTSNVLIKSIKLIYSIGASNKCSFIIYPVLDKWEDDTVSKELIQLDKADDSLFLTPVVKYYESAEYITKVIDCLIYNVVEWGSLYLSYEKPPGTDIEVYMRGSNSYFSDDNTTIPWVRQELGEVIKISVPHSTFSEIRQAVSYPYLQLKFVLKRFRSSNGIEYTPTIRGFSLNYYYKIPGPSYNELIDDLNIDSTGFFTAASSLGFGSSVSPFYPLIFRNQYISGIHKAPFDTIEVQYDLIKGYVGYTGGVSQNQETVIAFCESRKKKWHVSGAQPDGWRAAGAYLDNVTDTAIAGALTLSDPAKQGIWVSPPFKVENANRFLGWDTVEVLGSNLGQVTVTVEFSNSDTPTTWQSGGDYYDPFSNGVIRIPFLSNPTFRKYKWIRIKLTIRSN